MSAVPSALAGLSKARRERVREVAARHALGLHAARIATRYLDDDPAYLTAPAPKGPGKKTRRERRRDAARPRRTA